MKIIHLLGEILDCTPEHVDNSFWHDIESQCQLYGELYQSKKSAIKYSIAENKIKAILVYSHKLKFNMLEKLIKEIVDCEYFFLWFPELTELPASIGNLSSLSSLNISGTKISELPASIGNLSSLSSLNISGTKISELPESIGRLSALSSLDISWTKISELPESIGRLLALSSLDISAAEISELPESIGNLSSLSSLNISGTKISELPESIGNLYNLLSLNISGTKISELPESIGMLSALSSLDISWTKISELPESIGRLLALSSLDISAAEISELPESIGNLYNLLSLNISWTKISELPEFIGNLSALEFLNISETKISELPESIGNLSALSTLYIDKTEISKLPESIGRLSALSTLDISGTNIKMLPPQIYTLPLLSLNLSDLILDTLPKDILLLNLPFSFESYGQGILLNNTVILDIGISPFKLSLDEIKIFFDELERERVSFNEARVIFVGEGEAGKSTIINKLITGSYVEKLPETRGVQIRKWKIDSMPQSPLVSFWDFGGQAIMHSMHEFFLGDKCLYVVILDGRREEKPEYWLDIIRQYGRTSSVIIVMNKIDGDGVYEINQIKIARDYKDIFNDISFHLISCKRGDGIKEFIADLNEKITNMESCKKTFPGRWYRIREKLIDLKDEKGESCNYIREAQYRNICAEEGITDKPEQNLLLEFMNNLGACFSYNSKKHTGAVDELKVLRPEWITNGVYKIINSREAADNNGFVSHEEIKTVLARADDVNIGYHNTEKDFILGMMRDFKLSYQVEQHEFIPMLTADSEPELEEFVDDIHLQIRYGAPLSSYIFYNFIVLVQFDVDRHKTWKKGAFLKSSYGDCRAIVRFGKDRSIIDIYTEGKNKADYLRFLRRNLEFAQVNNEIGFSEFIEYTVGTTKMFLDLERFLMMFRKGMTEDYVKDIDQNVNIVDVLSIIAPDEIIDKLKSKIRESEHEIQKLKNRDFDYNEIRKQLFDIRDDTNKIIRDLHGLSCSIENITKFTETQFQKIIKLFSSIQEENQDPEILRIVTSILDEARKANSKNLKKTLKDLVSISGSVASYASLAPYIYQLFEILRGL